eukprot:g31734.t1
MVREQPDGLHVIDAVMIFRENIRPEWEDKMNAQGGHFQFQLKPNIGGGQVDEYWNNLVLGMIGATIEPANMITGLRLVDKLSGPRAAGVIRLEVWFTNYDDASAVQVLKKNVEKCMATRLALYSDRTGHKGLAEFLRHMPKTHRASLATTRLFRTEVLARFPNVM